MGKERLAKEGKKGRCFPVQRKEGEKALRTTNEVNPRIIKSENSIIPERRMKESLKEKILSSRAAKTRSREGYPARETPATKNFPPTSANHPRKRCYQLFATGFLPPSRGRKKREGFPRGPGWRTLYSERR